MARLARYAHITPTEFGAMTPARTLVLHKHVEKFLDDEWNGYIELAKMIAKAAMGGGRM